MVSYLIALLAVLFAAAVRFGLEPWLGGRAHYLVFVVAVFIAAMFGGSLPALFAAGLSVFAVKLLGETPPGEPSAGVEFLTFAGASAVVIWLVHLIMQLRRESALEEGRARRREEDAIRLAEERDLLIDGVPHHALIMLDGEGRVRIWNKVAERLLGWSEEEATGEPWSFVYPAAAVMAGKPGADLDRAREGDGFEERTALLGKNGQPLSALLSLAALHDPRGRFRGYALMLRG
jgi:two-component system sensor kinase FixL